MNDFGSNLGANGLLWFTDLAKEQESEPEADALSHLSLRMPLETHREGDGNTSFVFPSKLCISFFLL
jgi:hypothetical protein